MNLNINSNYQSPNFNAKKITPKGITKITSALGVGVVANTVVNQDKGMSAEELNGRTQVMSNPINSNPEVFNQEVSFNYFANGKLKDVPEYVEKGKERINELQDYEKGNKLNTLKYQEQIVDKILNEDALINNKGIREYLYYMINWDFNFPILDTDKENQYYMNYFYNKSQSLIKVLDAYANNTEMQKNEYINHYISDYSRFAKNEKQAEFLIEFLAQSANINDKQFFDNLDGLLRNNINPELIKKVQSDKELYNIIDSYILYNINGTDKEVAEKIIQVLNDYQDNYADSELVNKKIRDVLWKSFDYLQKEDPVEFAAKMMQEMVEKEKATKNETANEFCNRINTKLNELLSGKFDDKNKSDFEIVNNQINIIRELRTEIKDNAEKYSDIDSKKALSWTLGTVTARLDLMKQVREKMGWCTIGYDDMADANTNHEIFEMLK